MDEDLNGQTCEADIGFNAACGDVAVGIIEGVPYCEAHYRAVAWALDHQ